MEIQELTAKHCVLLGGMGVVPGQYVSEREPCISKDCEVSRRIETPEPWLNYLKLLSEI